MNIGQPISSFEIKEAIRNTCNVSLRQYKDFLSLGKIFETMGESKAAAECYHTFAQKVLQYQKDQDKIDYIEILDFYGMSLGSMTLNSFSGPVDFVLSASYLGYLHTAFVSEIIAKKVCYKESVPKNFRIACGTPAANFLKWIRNPHENRSMQSIAVFEGYLRELANSSSYQFVSNIKAGEICNRWRTAFTELLPINKKGAMFIYPYER